MLPPAGPPSSRQPKVLLISIVYVVMNPLLEFNLLKKRARRKGNRQLHKGPEPRVSLLAG